MLQRKNSKLNTWQTHQTQAEGHTHWMKDGTQNVLIVTALQNNLNISLKQSWLCEKLGFCSKRLWCFTTICFSTKSWALNESKGDEECSLSKPDALHPQAFPGAWGPQPMLREFSKLLFWPSLKHQTNQASCQRQRKHTMWGSILISFENVLLPRKDQGSTLLSIPKYFKNTWIQLISNKFQSHTCLLPFSPTMSHTNRP